MPKKISRALIIYLVFLSAFALLNSCICDGDNPPNLPTPYEVNNSSIPEESENIYYLIMAGTDYDGEIDESPDAILIKLLDNRISIKKAWYPLEGSPCMVITSCTALIVELKEKDDSIIDYGFVEEPGQWAANCGVNRFNLYEFD